MPRCLEYNGGDFEKDPSLDTALRLRANYPPLSPDQQKRINVPETNTAAQHNRDNRDPKQIFLDQKLTNVSTASPDGHLKTPCQRNMISASNINHQFQCLIGFGILLPQCTLVLESLLQTL
nr:hypothetical protein BaRGS_022516 [Batillaria attramentaria]